MSVAEEHECGVYQVFCSYSSRDKVQVDQLISELDQAELPVWLDRSKIRVGQRLRKEIVRAIKRSKIFLLIISPNSVASKYVSWELEVAADNGVKIIPVQLKKAKIPEEMQFHLSGVHYAENSREGLEQVKQSLLDLGVEPGQPTPASRSEPAWWSKAPLQFGFAGILAASGVWIADLLGVVPDSFESLRLLPNVEPGLLGFTIIGVLAIAVLAFLLARRWLGRNSPLWGFAIYLFVMLPVAIILGHLLAAGLGVAVGGAVATWRGMGAQLLRPGLLLSQAILLFTAPVIGVAAEQWKFDVNVSPERLLAVSSFSKSRNEQFDNEKLRFSNDFRDKLAQIFSNADIKVHPLEFDETYREWGRNNLEEKMRTAGLRPGILIKNTLAKCSNPSGVTYYSWYSFLDAESRNNESRDIFIKLVGKSDDADLLTLAAVFEVIRETQNNLTLQLNQEQQSRLRNEIVEELDLLQQIRGKSLEQLVELESPGLQDRDSIEEKHSADLFRNILVETADCPAPEDSQHAYIENLASLGL